MSGIKTSVKLDKIEFSFYSNLLELTLILINLERFSYLLGIRALGVLPDFEVITWQQCYMLRSALICFLGISSMPQRLYAYSNTMITQQNSEKWDQEPCYMIISDYSWFDSTN